MTRRAVPVYAKTDDWPRRVSQAIKGLGDEIDAIVGGAADGNISNVALNGSVDLNSLSSGSGFTPADLSASDATYLYFGFDTDWRIRRVLRADGTADEATNLNNGGYANLTAAWPDRATLTYA